MTRQTDNQLSKRDSWIGGVFLFMILLAIINHITNAYWERNVLEERGRFTVGKVVEIKDSWKQTQRYMLYFEFKTIDQQEAYECVMPLKQWVKTGEKYLVVYDPQDPFTSVLIDDIPLSEYELGEDLGETYHQGNVKIPL